MAGLLQQAMQPEQGATPPPSAQQSPQQPPQQSQQPQQQSQAEQSDPSVDMTEEGVQQRDMLVDAMLENLYGPLLEQTEKMMQQMEPQAFIERITASLMLAAWQRLREDGKTVPPAVMVQAGMMAAQAVGEMAIEAGMLNPDESEIIETGFMAAMARFGKSTKDAMPKPQRQRYAQLIQTLSEAKQQAQGEPSRQQPQGQPSAQGPMAGGMQ